MTPIISLNYLGHLRTEIIHTSSGATFLSDAPTDNNGQGKSFSPTDLTAASLGSCMLTIMGIVAEKNQIRFEKARAEVTKYMGTAPRRIIKLEVEILIQDENFTSKQKRLLENGAIHCPVAKSLNAEIEQLVRFQYFKKETEE